MPKKKKFIDRKNAVTFHLVHRSQRDPLQADEDAPKHVLIQADEDEKLEARASEQRKFGVFFDDDYDYLQHLKDVNEIYTDHYLEAAEYPNHQTVSAEFSEQVQKEQQQEAAISKGPKLNLPSTVFATEYETETGLLNKAVPIRGPQPDWDPDIVAALDDDFNFDDPDNQLEDDFMLQANTDCDYKEEDGFREGAGDYPSDEADDDYDEDDLSDLGSLGERSFMDEETKTRFTNYSMTSSVIRRNEGLTLLDDRFEKLYEQYDDDEIGALDQDEIEGSVQQNSTVLLSVMEEFEKTQNKPTMKNIVDASEETADNVEIVSESDSGTSDTEMVKMEIEVPKETWDCESILSTYSNLYNHPKTISESNKDRSIKLTKRAQIPVDSLPTRGLTRRQLEAEQKAQRKADRVSTYRDKNETAEEKRARKKAIKEERRERRVEKKATKEAFKSEQLRQEKELMNIKNNIQGLKIA